MLLCNIVDVFVDPIYVLPASWAVFITTVLCKVGLAAPSCLLLGCVDLLEGQYPEGADECIHSERVKANMVASLAERVDLSINKCDFCHMKSNVLYLKVNDCTTLCMNTTDIRETIETAEIGRWSSFCHKWCDSTCVSVLLHSSDGNVPVCCLCLELWTFN